MKNVHTMWVAVSLLWAATAPAQYTLVDAFPSFPAFSLPVECVHAGDGTDRMFIVEQRGRIYVINTANPATPPRLFLARSQ